MPQLPSGRHAAVDSRLIELWNEALQGRRVHELMAINEVKDLAPFLQIVELIPTKAEGRSRETLATGKDMFPADCFVTKATGVMVSQKEALYALWPGMDCLAFDQFLASPQFVQNIEGMLGAVKDLQVRLRSEGNLAAQIAVGWWLAGCHPAQEDGWNDIESTHWDDYDLLGALLVFTRALKPEEFQDDHAAWDTLMRLNVMWPVICAYCPTLVTWYLDADGPAREMGFQLRQTRALEAIGAQSLGWIRDQSIVFANNLFDYFDESLLRKIDQSALGIIKLVAMAYVDGFNGDN
ncbi:hypothetical protein [Chitinimonas sp.]|uniref:hypothetical protein n=1 Tax=Chitinimonas sp. TaxID=1934313 RepID=UPI0035B1ED27